MTNSVDRQYADLIHSILTDGDEISTRNSKVKRVFPFVMKFTSTPLISLRKTPWKTALREWEFFLTGSDQLEDAHSSVRPWWEPFANSEGRLPFSYGPMLRRCNGTPKTVAVTEYDRIEDYGYNTAEPVEVDQIQYLVDGIRDHPNSRRLVISTWGLADQTRSECRLTNCHSTVIQAFVKPDNSLHTVTYQRSSDVIVGLGANLLQQWGFLLWLAARTGRTPGSLTWVGGDCHLYDVHLPLAERIVAVADSSTLPPTPTLRYSPTSDDFKADDFSLEGKYQPLITERAVMVV